MRPKDTGNFATYDHLVSAIWNLQFDGLSQAQIKERCGVSDALYRKARLEALNRFEPEPDHIKKLLSQLPTSSP